MARRRQERGRMTQVLVPVLALAALVGSMAPAGGADEVATIGIDEITRGQQGFGLSVFAGSEPERFELEVLGVLRNLNPDASFILARLSGRGLEKSGVVSGMSGSPVFIDGRLAGAVAFSWPFSQDAIAGITPIADMRQLDAGGAGAGGGAGTAGAATEVELATLAAGRAPEGLLERELGRLRPQLAGGAAAALQWSAAGFASESSALLARTLGAVELSGQAAGEGRGGAALQPGSPVAAVLVGGDFRLAAIGTLTDRRGDEVVAFGHAVLGIGELALPMAEAEVITVISSRNSSFKVSNLGPVVGTFNTDRRAGLAGQVGAAAPTIPLRVLVRGTAEREFNLQLAAVSQLTPALLATGVLGSLDAATYQAGAQGLDLEATFHLTGYEPLVARQSFDGASASADVVSYLLALTSFLVQNELEEVTLERAEVELTQVAEPRTATLVGAHAGRTVVRPGDVVRLHLDLKAYRGEAFRRTMEVELPADLPAGRYSLLVGDGSSIDVARLAAESAEPVSFPQALDLLRSFHSQRDLMVLGVFGGRGLSVAGQPMPRLPGSVRSLWTAAPSGSSTPLRLAVAQEQVEHLPFPVSGILRVDLEVERREPMTAAEVGEGGETSEGAEAAPPSAGSPNAGGGEDE